MDIKEAIKQLTKIRNYRAYWLKYADLKCFIEQDIAALDLAIRVLEHLSAAKPDGTRGLTNEETTIYDNQLLSRSKSTGLEMKIND